MKNKRLNIILIVILAAIVLAAGVFAAIKLLNRPTVNAPNEESKTVQLLSFDSYEEMTGTKIRLENEFGRIDVNTDQKYITEGSGSIAVFPQGDYNRSGWNPYMQLDCANTTFATNDFTEFESVTMDVYNDSDKEREIAVYFTVANYSESFLVTPTVTFTLAPNDWTECTYQVSEQIVASYFNLANVRWMTIVFPDHKEAKDEEIKPIYLDNLYGTRYDVVPEITPLEYDFYKGVGFEDIAEQYLVSGETAATNRMPMERVSYEDAGIQPKDGFGEYLMQADVTGSTWPSFLINYGDIVKKGTILTFWAYIDVENTKDDTYIIQSQTNAHGFERVPNTVAAGENPFNKWFPVRILLEGNSDVTYTHFNFDDFNTEEGVTRFGNKPVKIYIDNIQLEKAEPAVSVDKKGNITLRNPLGTTTLSYDIDRAYKKGQAVAFDIDFNVKENVSIWVLADGKWNTATEVNEFYARNFPKWSGKQTIMAEMERDVQSLTVVVKYFNTNNLRTKICKISNIRLMESRAKVKANGDVVISNPTGEARYVYDFMRPVKKGQRIAFDINFNTKKAVAVWLLAEGKWNTETNKTNEWYAYGYEKWDGKQTIVVEATRDISFFSIGHEYRGSGSYKGNVCTISNVRILNPDATVDKKGNVTLKNQLGTDTIFYDKKMSVKSDEMVHFDIDFNSTEPVTIWVLAEGLWGTDNEFYAYSFESWAGPKRIVAPATRDAKWFRIYVKYGGDTDPSKKICTIKNIGKEDYVPNVVVDENGDVTLNNRIDTSKNVYYTINSPAKQDGKLKFDIDFNNDEAVAVWVLGEGKWENEFYAYGYDAWDGKKTIEAPVKCDVDSLQIVVQYRGDESNWRTNVCKISNIQIFEPDVEVGADGTVTIRNSSGSKNIMYDINQPLIKGSQFVFDVDFNVDEAVGIWVLADGKWNEGTEKNELFANGYDDWKAGKTITVDVTKDVSKLQIFVQYRGEEPHTQKVCTLSNITWSEPDIIENPDGSVTIRNSAGEENVYYEVTGDIKAGSTFSFDIAVNTTEEIGLWVLGDGSWDNEWFAQGTPINGTQNVSLEVKKDVSSLLLQIAYRGDEPHTEKVCTLSNIKIEEPDIVVAPDGTVTIRNSTGAQDVFYEVTGEIKAGSTFSFDIGVNTTEEIGLWVLGDGSWSNEWFAQGAPINGTQSVSLQVRKDVSKLLIQIRYRGAEPHTGKIATLSNIKLEEPSYEITALNTGAPQDHLNRWLFRFDTTVSFGGGDFATWLGGKTIKVNDGTNITEKTVDCYDGTTGKIGVPIPYSILPKDATGYSFTIPAGTAFATGGVTYKLKNDVTFEYADGAWRKYEKPEFTITGITSGAPQDHLNRWLFRIDSDVSFGDGNFATWLGGKTVTVASSAGTANANVDFYDATTGKIGIPIPFSNIPQDATGYSFTIPEGLQITSGGRTYTLTQDATFKYVDGAWIMDN